MKLLLNYIEHFTNETAIASNSELVLDINDVVQSIKNSERELENYMALALLTLLDNETIAQTTKLSIEKIKALRKKHLKS